MLTLILIAMATLCLALAAFNVALHAKVNLLALGLCLLALAQLIRLLPGGPGPG